MKRGMGGPRLPMPDARATAREAHADARASEEPKTGGASDPGPGKA